MCVSAVSAAWALQPAVPTSPPDRLPTRPPTIPTTPTIPPSEVPLAPRQAAIGKAVYLASSPDGVEWTESAVPLLLKASSPALVELAASLPKPQAASGARGTIQVYAIEPGADAKVLRVWSGDGGRTWSKPQPVTLRDKPDGAPTGLSVVQLDDGRLRLYVSLTPPARRTEPGRPRPEDLNRPSSASPAVHSAVSEDGLAFAFEPGTRLASAGIADPDVIRSGSEWLMFHTAGRETRVARSPDGLTFAADDSIRLPDGRSPAAVPMSDGSIRVFVVGQRGVVSVRVRTEDKKATAEVGTRLPLGADDPAAVVPSEGPWLMLVTRGS